MRFFVPGVPDEEAEERYAELAAALGVRVAPPEERVESVTFTSDRDEVEATVGHRMRATQYPRTRSGRPDESRPPRRRTTGTTVVAIFAGSPYQLWREPGPSEWTNPILLTATSVRYFDPPEVTEKTE